MIVLDTHIWIWFISNPEFLSENASRAIKKAIKQNGILISAISTWEIAMLISKDRLKLTMDTGEWIRRSEILPFIKFVPVDNQIALKSTLLPGQLHNDPADRIIAATAMIAGASLVSKDERLLKYPHLKTIW
ncbi:MAG: type II toxin-antitoxin system VapC family toxin [Spirochaetes bacterium]|jgi:PIN domain nuclease of toxin-antitoxin system|nr:type II toxin-antitoxin system VapC family toxin [Spirochaetota bacterium]